MSMSQTDTVEIGAAYIRVSTNDQTELSPDAQLREILKKAKEDGMTIPPEFIFIEEKGVSGRRADNRKEFQRMIAVAKTQPPPFCRLYLWKFSRFARNQDESVFYKSILRKKCGIDIKSVSEPIADGMFGRLIESIIEWFDEYYSFNLSGEVIRGMTEKALRNGYQSVPPLGYAAVGRGNPFVIEEEAFKIVEFIHQSYHAGKDMSSIARELNQMGHFTRRGNPFERRTVCGILENRFYIGEVTWNGIHFRGEHEVRRSILDVFEDNQRRMEREYRPVKRREASACRHWLSGLLKCGTCGASLSFHRSNDKTRRSDYYQCWKYLKGFHAGSNSISVRRAEKAVMNSLRQILDDGEITYEYASQPDKTASPEEFLLREALSRVETKERRVREAYENGIDTIEEYRANKERLRQEQNELRRQLEELKHSSCSESVVPDKEAVLSRVQSVYDMISDPEVGFEIKGNALRQVLKQIVYDRKNDEFHFYYYA